MVFSLYFLFFLFDSWPMTRIRNEKEEKIALSRLPQFCPCKNSTLPTLFPQALQTFEATRSSLKNLRSFAFLLDGLLLKSGFLGVLGGPHSLSTVVGVVQWVLTAGCVDRQTLSTEQTMSRQVSSSVPSRTLNATPMRGQGRQENTKRRKSKTIDGSRISPAEKRN